MQVLYTVISSILQYLVMFKRMIYYFYIAFYVLTFLVQIFRSSHYFSYVSYLFINHHLISYPCPRNINVYWNCGFLLGFVIYIQILTGILLGLHYTPDIYSAYYSVIHIYREVYFGWYFRFIHSSVASFVFITVFLHLTRGIFYGSYFYMSNVLFTGIILFILLMIDHFFL